MNCKPGDLARIVHPRAYGKFVDVMYEAPRGSFVLPDGHPAGRHANESFGWVCQFHGEPMRAKLDDGGSRMAHYGVIADKYLRPIRDNDGEDEMLRIAGKPQEVNA